MVWRRVGSGLAWVALVTVRSSTMRVLESARAGVGGAGAARRSNRDRFGAASVADGTAKEEGAAEKVFFLLFWLPMSLGTNLSQTVKGKLNLGARILQAGGIEKLYVQNFSVEEGEKLLDAFQCYLSTTAGLIAGVLFISTEKITFHSDRSIKLTSAREEIARIPYKHPTYKHVELNIWYVGLLVQYVGNGLKSIVLNKISTNKTNSNITLFFTFLDHSNFFVLILCKFLKILNNLNKL
ncbi:hypothetical protein HPP92_012870 [Vanilla planifolia]|uniref:GRAM domain-containing protein n=1 Tax=Vanilla planifolia TaxID=51239 RepID=A0A835QNW7_VANPL|nr:hypothetical protein HPP92_012870 [Vanilla planifolia]